MPEHATVTRPRPRTAPIGPRRISGPSRVALPARPATRHRGRTSAFEKISRIPDHRVVDRLLRGRACILIIGLMLGGIVAMQVSLLRLNSGIQRAVATSNTLAAQNMWMEKSIAEAQSGDSVMRAATEEGMIVPSAGDRRFLNSRGLAKDAPRAAKRYKPISAKAQAVTDNGGMLPGALAEPGTAAANLAAQLNGQPVVTPTTDPVTGIASAAPTVVPTVTAAPTVVPTVTPTPPVTTPPDTGVATSPVG
jgi:hypothetical protein